MQTPQTLLSLALSMMAAVQALPASTSIQCAHLSANAPFATPATAISSMHPVDNLSFCDRSQGLELLTDGDHYYACANGGDAASRLCDAGASGCCAPVELASLHKRGMEGVLGSATVSEQPTEDEKTATLSDGDKVADADVNTKLVFNDGLFNLTGTGDVATDMIFTNDNSTIEANADGQIVGTVGNNPLLMDNDVTAKIDLPDGLQNYILGGYTKPASEVDDEYDATGTKLIVTNQIDAVVEMDESVLDLDDARVYEDGNQYMIKSDYVSAPGAIGSCGFKLDYKNTFMPMVSLSPEEFGDGKNLFVTSKCLRCVLITAPSGKSVIARVAAMGGLDLPPGYLQLSQDAARLLHPDIDNVGIAPVHYNFTICPKGEVVSQSIASAIQVAS